MVVDDEKWYTQRGTRLQGPFSRQTIHRYLLLGRIKNSDRVSRDGEMWEPITQVPQLIPDELLDLSSDMGWTHFLKAREQIDQRDSKALGVVTNNKPIVTERRDDEDAVLTKLRKSWIDILSLAPQKTVKANMLPLSLFGVTVAVVLIMMFTHAIT
jgi:hypothetical protein